MGSAQRLAVVLGAPSMFSAFAGRRTALQPAQATWTYSPRAIREDIATLYRNFQLSASGRFDRTIRPRSTAVAGETPALRFRP